MEIVTTSRFQLRIMPRYRTCMPSTSSLGCGKSEKHILAGRLLELPFPGGLTLALYKRTLGGKRKRHSYAHYIAGLTRLRLIVYMDVAECLREGTLMSEYQMRFSLGAENALTDLAWVRRMN